MISVISRLVVEIASRASPLAVAAADHCRGHDWSLCTIRSRRDFSAGATATESPSRSSSVSKLVGACTSMGLDELGVRSPLTSNRNPSLTSNRSSVVCRDPPCASPRCLQAAQVVETKREQLERGRAIAAAAAVGERPILSHVCGQQRDRHRAQRGLRAACVQHAAEGQQRRRFGLQPSLSALGLGSLAQLSS